MTDLQRKNVKIFAINSGAQGTSEFGSLKSTGNFVFSQDINDLQTSEYETGWRGAVVNGKTPTIPDFNTISRVISEQVAYLYQKGMAEWSSEQTYFIGNKCMVINNGVPQEYYSLTNNNIGNNPLNDTINWQQLSLNGGYDLFDFKFCDHELDNIAWLRADTFSWQSGTTYNIAYNHLLSDIQGKETQTETIGNTTISYYLADDGHKIVDVANISQVESVYSETGIAWYYILDTTNTQFKLPRTKYGFVGLRNGVGNFVSETLPNITGSATIAGGANQLQVYNTTGCFTYTEYGNSTATISGQSAQANKGLTLNANLSNPVYQDNASVQQKATQMYLYFYVGNFTREAIEETAGLNSELFNNKVDLDCSNISNTGKEIIANFGMPSDQYIDLSVTSGTNNYGTAPTNGYIVLQVANCSHYRVWNKTISSAFGIWNYQGTSMNYGSGFVPITKGQEWGIFTQDGTITIARFYYLAGSSNN